MAGKTLKLCPAAYDVLASITLMTNYYGPVDFEMVTCANPYDGFDTIRLANKYASVLVIVNRDYFDRGLDSKPNPRAGKVTAQAKLLNVPGVFDNQESKYLKGTLEWKNSKDVNEGKIVAMLQKATEMHKRIWEIFNENVTE